MYVPYASLIAHAMLSTCQYLSYTRDRTHQVLSTSATMALNPQWLHQALAKTSLSLTPNASITNTFSFSSSSLLSTFNVGPEPLVPMLLAAPILLEFPF